MEALPFMTRDLLSITSSCLACQKNHVDLFGDVNYEKELVAHAFEVWLAV